MVVLDIAIEVDVAQAVDVVLQAFLDVDVGIVVVLSESKAHSAARPGEQNTFGELGREDGLHATSKSDAMQDEVVIVELHDHLGTSEHLLCGWTLPLRVLDHLNFAILLLHDLAHGEGFERCALLHHLLHS